jgi:hypothetical protein
VFGGRRRGSRVSDGIFIDFDGDGHGDSYAVEHDDHGNTYYAGDMNHDGRIDAVAVDHDGDGLIEEAYFDNNFDGRPETHTVDVDHDGYQDRSYVIPDGGPDGPDGYGSGYGDAPGGGDIYSSDTAGTAVSTDGAGNGYVNLGDGQYATYGDGALAPTGDYGVNAYGSE